MKLHIYHAIIALGILLVGLSFWFTMAPASRDELTVDDLRRMLHEGASPEERALGAAGLGARNDLQSMPQLLDALGDTSPVVRARAEIAVSKILGVKLRFDADAPPAQQQEIIDEYRLLWEYWQTELNSSSTSH